MSQQEGESADLPSPQETRTPIPEFLTSRLARVGLGAVTSLVLASAAFAQGAWNGDEAAGSRTPAVEPDQEGEALPSPSSPPPGLLLADSSSGRPSTKDARSPEADRKPAHRPVQGPPAPSTKRGGSDSTGGASPAGGGRSVTKAAPESGGSRSTTTTQSATKPKPSLTAWASRNAEDNPYWDAHTVTVRSTVPITSLKVSVRVIQTGGVANTGAWSSLGDQVEIRSAANGNELDYHVVLKPGITLQPGTYTFQFGFNHNPGTRDAGRDLWNIVATGNEFSSSQMRSGRF
jgi:hypothetical protein